MAKARKPKHELRVLVADDSHHWQQVIGDALETTGLKPVVVFDGVPALRELEEALKTGKPFHAMITDNSMIRMDGIELIHLLWKRPEFTSLKIVMASGGECPEDLSRKGFPFIFKNSIDEEAVARKVIAVAKGWKKEGLGK